MPLKITRETSQSLRVKDETTGDSVLLSHDEIDQIVKAKEHKPWPAGFYILANTTKVSELMRKHGSALTIQQLLDGGATNHYSLFYVGTIPQLAQHPDNNAFHVQTCSPAGVADCKCKVWVYYYWIMLYIKVAS